MSTKSTLSLIINLSLMMFLLFFVWGAWFPTVGAFLTEKGMVERIGWAYSCTPIAAIITPFFMGFIADRYFNAERLQGILMILSGVFIGAAPTFAKPETGHFFIGLLMLHALCFTPTLGLSNAICLKHLSDADTEYPRVRIFATLGWIFATAVVVSLWLKADTSPIQFYVAAIAAFVVGIYSFCLPKTPPPAKGNPVRFSELIGKDVFPYFRDRSFATFMFVSLLGCIGFMPYWAQGSSFPGFLGVERVGAFLSMGQWAEVIVLAFVVGIFIKKLGIKWTIVVGLAFWVVRYSLMGLSATSGSVALLAIAVIMHGFCYDFVFVAGYLYVDRKVKKEVSAQAQGLLVVFTQGIGLFLGSQIFSRIHGKVVGSENVTASGWQTFWWLPAAYLAILLVVFFLFFKDSKESSA